MHDEPCEPEWWFSWEALVGNRLFNMLVLIGHKHDVELFCSGFLTDVWWMSTAVTRHTLLEKSSLLQWTRGKLKHINTFTHRKVGPVFILSLSVIKCDIQLQWQQRDFSSLILWICVFLHALLISRSCFYYLCSLCLIMTVITWCCPQLSGSQISSVAAPVDIHSGYRWWATPQLSVYQCTGKCAEMYRNMQNTNS